jgi:hypothetical protein
MVRNHNVLRRHAYTAYIELLRFRPLRCIIISVVLRICQNMFLTLHDGATSCNMHEVFYSMMIHIHKTCY